MNNPNYSFPYSIYLKGYIMQELSKGQKVKLNSSLQLKFDNFYDISCFCLYEDGKLISDDYMIFYNQLSLPDQTVVLNKDNDQQTFVINLDKISPLITKLSFVMTADDKILKNLDKTLTCTTNDFSFSVSPQQLENEKALMFCEVYIKDGQWRYNAYAQGFNDGLPAVVSLYSKEAVNEPIVAPITLIEPVVSSKIELPEVIIPKKISLTKESSTTKISLTKDVGSKNMIEVSTLWYDNGDGNSGNDDLDLRVGLLLPDGRMTLIHAGELGSLEEKPYILHTGDVQVVQGSCGVETVKVNPNISHFLGGKVGIVFSVYSAVSNGVVSVASLRPNMEIKTKDHLINCEFNKDTDSNPRIYTYVIGMVVIDGDNLTVKQLGLTSKPGSEETPWLSWDGEELLPNIEINGPRHFKGESISANSVSIGGPSIFGKKNKKELRYVEYRNM